MFLSRTDFHRILKDAEQGQVMQGIPREFEPFGDLVTEIGDWTIRDDWDDEAEIERDVTGNRRTPPCSRNPLRPSGAIGACCQQSGMPISAGFKPVSLCRPQRSMPVRQRQEVQALLRAVEISSGSRLSQVEFCDGGGEIVAEMRADADDHDAVRHVLDRVVQAGQQRHRHFMGRRHGLQAAQQIHTAQPIHYRGRDDHVGRHADGERYGLDRIANHDGTEIRRRPVPC